MSPFKYIFLIKQIAKDKYTISELADGIGEKLPNTCKMVTRLEKTGYVKKSFGGVKRFVFLTEKGKEVLERVRE